MTIDTLLKQAVEKNASDLHLSAGLPAIVRIDGELEHLNDTPLDHAAVEKLIITTMNEKQQKIYHDDLEIDFSYEVKNLARFRVNAFHQARGASCAFRTIPAKAVTLEAIGAPEVFKTLCENHNGIILLTGPTGSGKSTTLAAMIDHINQTSKKHILTIEDPIEFVHESKQCIINQREVGQSTQSFAQALRSALREDPDVILVGEMRDLESIRLALTAAETGHLVLSTLHTNSAPETIDRIVNVFPAGEQGLIRGMLSVALRASIAQSLLKKVGGGRVAAYETMICTPAVRNLIRENKIPQIISAMQTGQAEGMQTKAMCVKKLLDQKLITPEAAARFTD